MRWSVLHDLFGNVGASGSLYLLAGFLTLNSSGNREKLKESESFVLTLLKEVNNNTQQTRVNVKKISDLNDLVNKPYKNICIELNEDCDFSELESFLGL